MARSLESLTMRYSAEYGNNGGTVLNVGRRSEAAIDSRQRLVFRATLRPRLRNDFFSNASGLCRGPIASMTITVS